MSSVRTSLLAVLVIFSGSVLAQIELMDSNGLEGSSGDCGTIISTVQTSQRQLDKLEAVINKMALEMDLRHHKLLEYIEIISYKINLLEKTIETSYTKIIQTENTLSQLTSHIDGKVDALQVALNNVSDTLYINNTTYCQVSSETAGFANNITTRIEDIDVRTSNISAILHKMNETMQNLTVLNVPDLKINVSKPNDLVNSTTEQGHNISAALNITTEVNNLAPSECDRSQHEQCCTADTEYIDMSARGRHTAVNVASADLREYTMYFAVRGQWIGLQLSPTSRVIYDDLYYTIVISGKDGGHIFMTKYLSRNSELIVQDVYTSNIISPEQYSFYYLTITGDTLKVGRRGEPPLLTHTSTELRRLRYLIWLRGLFTNDKILYDCTAE